MSEYICNHGDLYMSCPVCSEVTKLMDEMMPEPWEDDEYMEYMYDYYLDKDERLLRESEEN